MNRDRNTKKASKKKISKKRQRKIELIQEMINSGASKTDIHNKALYFFKMSTEDYQVALDGRNIY